MFQINQITDSPNQTSTVILPDNSSVTFTLQYFSQQYGWFITSLAWGNITLQGIRVCNSPNILLQFTNQLTWGLACYTTGNREPTQLQDFSSGASKLYILDSTEINEYVGILNGSI